MASWVLHVDLDQFIAAVEILRRPQLRGRPVVVGGDGDPTKRGVVSTASYEARAYGVHSGMPLRTAARRLPDAVFLPVDADAYLAASAQVMAVLRQLPAVVEVAGWDEAFLAADTDHPERLARLVQARVLAATGLHCTVGIGANKLQAKVATGFGKPAGVCRLTEHNWYAMVGERRPSILWGIGPKTEKRLARLGIHTVARLATADPGLLAASFGPAIGPGLVRLAQGRCDSPVLDLPRVARSHSRETTFQQDLGDWKQVREELVRLAGELWHEVNEDERMVNRVVVKVRFAPFETHTHRQPTAKPTRSADDIERAALAALDKFAGHEPVRLIGVRVEFAEP